MYVLYVMVIFSELLCHCNLRPCLKHNDTCRTDGVCYVTSERQSIHDEPYTSFGSVHNCFVLLQLNGSVKEPNILIYFFFPPITQSCSVSDVLFTGGRGVSHFSVLKYY